MLNAGPSGTAWGALPAGLVSDSVAKTESVPEPRGPAQPPFAHVLIIVQDARCFLLQNREGSSPMTVWMEGKLITQPGSHSVALRDVAPSWLQPPQCSNPGLSPTEICCSLPRSPIMFILGNRNVVYYSVSGNLPPSNAWSPFS